LVVLSVDVRPGMGSGGRGRNPGRRDDQEEEGQPMTIQDVIAIALLLLVCFWAADFIRGER
jgi:hypothetical protein